MGILCLKTMLVNKTGQLISFDVEDGGTCPLRDLPAGESQSVSLSRIRKCCRERRSPNWPIRVLINGHFHGMLLHPRHHILKMTRIVFRYNWNGSCVPMAEGVVENFFDRMFHDCCINWQRRIFVEIAKADSTWRSTIRSSQEPNIVVGTSALRNGNNQRLREIGDPDVGIERRKRLYRLLSLRRRHIFNRFLLLALAFILVAAVHFPIWLCV